MVHFDVALTEGSVPLTEVERTHGALEGLPEPACVGNLAFAQGGTPLAKGRPTGQETPFGGRDSVLIHFVGLLRDKGELAGRNPVLNGLGSEQHLCLTYHECLSDEFGQMAASGGGAGVVAAACDQVRALATDAGGRPEFGHVACHVPVEGQRAEKLGKIVCGLLVRPELSPVVAYDTRADQQQLIPGPVRATHGQYRMRVRRGARGVWSRPTRASHWRAVVMSVGSVTLCNGGMQRVSAMQVRKEGA